MNSRSSVAAIVLAHDDAAQVRRLLSALAPAPVFVHCDAATPDSVLAAMLEGSDDQVRLTRRLRTWRGSWSLVQAELEGLREALDRSAADFIAIMSGSCYPLHSLPALEAELASTPGQSRLDYFALPHEAWATRLGLEGGLWRVGLRFLSVGGRPVKLRGRPVPVGRARIPSTLALHGASEWKIYARAHAQQLLAVLDGNPQLIRFFRHSFIPEESCVPTILKSPALTGELAESLVPSHPWLLQFPSSRSEGQDAHGHADWLTVAAFPKLQRAADADQPSHDRALFARKFRSADPELLGRVDAELRRTTGTPGPSLA